MTENFNEDTEQKIIEALEQPEEESEFVEETDETFFEEEETEAEISSEESFEGFDNTEEQENSSFSQPAENIFNETSVFQQDFVLQPEMKFEDDFTPIQESQPHAIVEKFASELYNFEIPSNVAVLKKLIAKLPSGVTRQTGAQIIKQTMEALGISIKNVLQDAQQVQDQLSSSAKECQITIQEYKRQIATLEEQSQSYKKQYANLNELVSLFIQTEN